MRAFIFMAACCLWLPVQAATIYKCSESGRTVYREQPCSGAGAVLALPPAPAPDPAFEARQERARTLAADIDARNANEAALAERDARDAARRQQRRAEQARLTCARLRQAHQTQAERDGQAVFRARGAARRWAEDEARANARRREQTMAAECPA